MVTRDLDAFFERAAHRLERIPLLERPKFWAFLVEHLSVGGRGSYVDSEVPGEAPAWNELFHQVGNKMLDDILDEGHEYSDRAWLAVMRETSHYGGVDVERSLAWSLDATLMQVVADWRSEFDHRAIYP